MPWLLRPGRKETAGPLRGLPTHFFQLAQIYTLERSLCQLLNLRVAPHARGFGRVRPRPPASPSIALAPASSRRVSVSTAAAAAAAAAASRRLAPPPRRCASIRRQAATLRLCSSSVRAKACPPRAVGDEVDDSRSRSGFAAASIAARPGLAIGVGGSPAMHIGVVGRRRRQLARPQPAPQRPLPLGDAVDHRRVGLQPHAAPQPVDEDRRHPRAAPRRPRSPSPRSRPASAAPRATRSGRSGARPAQAAARISSCCACHPRQHVRPRRRRAGNRTPPAPAIPSGGSSATSPVSSAAPVRSSTTCQLVSPSGTTTCRTTLPPRFSSSRISSHRGPGRDAVLAEPQPAVELAVARRDPEDRRVARSRPPPRACPPRSPAPRRARPASSTGAAQRPRARDSLRLRPGRRRPKTTTSPRISRVSAFAATCRIIGGGSLHAGAAPARRWCRRSRTSSTAPRRSPAPPPCSGARSIGVATDGFSRLIVGGATWSRIASTQKIASTAPAAPSRCPVADLVDDIVTLPAALPSSRATAPELDLVAHRRRGAVRVDVVDRRPASARRSSAPPSSPGSRRRRPAPAR